MTTELEEKLTSLITRGRLEKITPILQDNPAMLGFAYSTSKEQLELKRNNPKISAAGVAKAEQVFEYIQKASIKYAIEEDNRELFLQLQGLGETFNTTLENGILPIEYATECGRRHFVRTIERANESSVLEGHDLHGFLNGGRQANLEARMTAVEAQRTQQKLEAEQKYLADVETVLSELSVRS